jgi:2-dehydropantoate 2-reductase
MKWSKLLTNIISNASSAITGWSPNEVFSHPDLYRLEVEALRETVRVMRAKGITPVNLPKVPVSLLSFGIFLPSRITQNILGSIVTKGRGSKRPSFHYDIGRSRSEVKWLNGAVVMEGELLDLPTPANRVLTETMLSLVENAEKHKQFRHRPDQLLHRAEKAGVPGIQGYNP